MLRYADNLAGTILIADAQTWILREVEKRTGGRIKVEYHWAGSLVTAANSIESISKGLADMGPAAPAYARGDLPLLNVINVPCIIQDSWSGNLALGELVEMPEIKAELDGKNIVYISGKSLHPFQSLALNLFVLWAM